MTIRYLTGATGDYLEQGLSRERGIGLLIQPGNRYDTRVGRYPAWAADNGAFTRKGGFDPAKFRAMLARPTLTEHAATCLFVVAPDVLVVHEDGTAVGDARATLEQFPAWSAEIRGLGFPVALVAQDGLEGMLDQVPWDMLDVLFLGGSTEWKLSAGARACVEAARSRGKRTHMGRVNSYKRLAIANGWGCDTADGTFLAFGPTKNVPRLLKWLDKLEEDEMKVYLAGPIFGCDDEAANGWRREAAQQLEAAGVEVLDPMSRDFRGREDDAAAAIVQGDKNDIQACDAVLANAERPSWGTAMEVMYAYTAGRRVVSFCGGKISPWLRYHTVAKTTLAEAVQSLLRMKADADRELSYDEKYDAGRGGQA